MLDAVIMPVPVDQQCHEFTAKSIWQRIAIIAAGPFCQFFVGGYFVYFILAFGGIRWFIGDCVVDEESL